MFDYLLSILLVILSGLFSGLNLGLLGLNVSELERKIRLGNRNAAKVYPLRKKGNQLLVTLLLGNVAVNAALSIFLAGIVSGLVGGLISTGLIVVFGEIIPQATCARYALAIGSKTVWIVRIFMFVLAPICWPIAKLLDKVLGEELPTIFRKAELAEIIKDHEDADESDVDEDEEKIIIGALKFSDKKVKDVMSNRPDVYALELDEILDKEKVFELQEEGYSRIPVYENCVNNITGVLYVKDLITYDPEDAVPVENKYRVNNLLRVDVEDTLDDVLNLLIKKRTHMALVYYNEIAFVGIITLEDILEEIIGREIEDETDEEEQMSLF